MSGPLASWLWLSLASVGADSPGIAVPCEGEPFAASLAAIDSQWNLTFEATGGPRRMPASALVSWGQLMDSSQRPLFLFAHGTVLVADLTRVHDDDVVLESGVSGWTRVPRRDLRGVILQPPVGPLARDQWADRVLTSQQTEDRFWLANGDELTGRLLPTPDEAVSDLFGLASLRVAVPGTDVPLSLDVRNVVAIALASKPSPTQESHPAKACLGLRDGSRLLINALMKCDGDYELTVAQGTQLHVAAATLLAETTFLQPCAPEVRYLSDLEPVAYQHVPFLTLSWPWGRDRNVLGGHLRSGGRIYLKGLGMHSTSRLIFKLEGGYRVFQADLALDDSAQTLGSVTYRLFLEFPSGSDASARWKPAWESPVVRAGQSPIPVAVNVEGATRIALVVDAADRGDVLDHANWLHARLRK